MINARIRLLLVLIVASAGITFLTANMGGANATITGHADIGDCAWGHCCGLDEDGGPDAHCRWAAGVDCCNKGAGKLALPGSGVGDAVNGWDYKCLFRDCPDDDCGDSDSAVK